jgi:iron complex transport system substrate-binding protein
MKHALARSMRIPAAAMLLVSAYAVHAAHAAPTAPRVVAIGGAITEIVYALGAGRSLVAVDTTSTFPPATAQLPKVGYQRTLSAEGLLSVRPRLVIATAEAGPPNVLQQVRAAGVTLAQADIAHTPENVMAKIALTAALLDRASEGKRLEASFAQHWAATRARVGRYTTTPRVLFILDQSGAGSMVAGSGTAADAMIGYSGGVNALGNMKGYKPLTAEAVIAAAPDVLLITTEGLKAIGGVGKLLERPGLGLTPAGRNRKVVAMDGLYLLGFGPRLPQAVGELAGRLHQ